MKHKPLIIVISLLIPLVVAILYFMPKISGFEIDFLPKVNATLNGTVFFTLIFAIRAIKSGNKKLHTNLILTSLVLSFWRRRFYKISLFLCFIISYFAFGNCITSSTNYFIQSIKRKI